MLFSGCFPHSKIYVVKRQLYITNLEVVEVEKGVLWNATRERIVPEVEELEGGGGTGKGGPGDALQAVVVEPESTQRAHPVEEVGG